MAFTKAVVNKGDSTGMAAGTYAQFAIYTVTGDSSYLPIGSGGETVDLSAHFSTIDYVSEATVFITPAFHDLIPTDWSTPSAVKFAVRIGTVECGSGVDLTGDTWTIFIFGRKTIT